MKTSVCYLCALIALVSLCFVGDSAAQITVRTALKNTETIVCSDSGRSVTRTVAEGLRQIVGADAVVLASSPGEKLDRQSVMRVAIADENFASVPQRYGQHPPKDMDWAFFRMTSSGDGELVASKPHLLYALFCRLKEDWLDEDIASFEKGRLLTTTFKWLEGNDGFFVGRARFTKDYDPEASIKELARLGCSHVTVNGLATPFPFEEGPPGEIYYRFYVSSPDLDQFVESELSKGTYPPEYLEANLDLLKKNAALAIKYGLTPGLTICAPRSVPESLLEKYPHLRGARVDHSFRSYRPRYTLTLSHPVVRWHYAQLMNRIMREVPELGFVYIWTNDSGSGFEYTSTLYPGRNGGAYLVREWRDEEAYPKAAAENVLRYYRLIRDSASEINPDFRVISGLFSFPVEGDMIVAGLEDRLDLLVSPSDRQDKEAWRTKLALRERGSDLLSSIRLVGNYILGVPIPWLCYERLTELTSAGIDRCMVSFNPVSLAPYDVNREILRAFQLGDPQNSDQAVLNAAVRMVGEDHASDLVALWQLTDEAVRSFPEVPLYGNSWAFPWYRLWIRPFVPDIERIPKCERDYYEKYMIATFNNPTLVDLRRDALWDLISPERAEQIVEQCDGKVWQPLEKAIAGATAMASELPEDDPGYPVFVDLRDRLRGVRCYFRTLRNAALWIVGVHGYLDASADKEKSLRLRQVREMVQDEIENTRDLLELFRTTEVDFMPMSSFGESWHAYGDNFAEVLEKKISLMENHKADVPYIDPNFMWRMPGDFPVEADEYLKY